MTLMGLTGALMGVAASVAGRIGKRADDQRVVERFKTDIELLKNEVAQLENTVNLLERRLGTAESLVDHWRSEARRLVHENRELRIEAQAQSFAQAAAQYQQAQQALGQQPQYAQLYQLYQQANAQQNFCNCVPSRSQVLGASHGLLERLNRGEA